MFKNTFFRRKNNIVFKRPKIYRKPIKKRNYESCNPFAIDLIKNFNITDFVRKYLKDKFIGGSNGIKSTIIFLKYYTRNT